jgi:TonB family protein
LLFWEEIVKRFVALMALWPLAVHAQVQTAPQGQAQPASTITAPAGIGTPHSCPSGEWYPPAAIAKHEQGTTLLAFRIGVDGIPKDVTVAQTSGFADLDQVSVACASQFKYRPAMQDGHPVEVPWKLSLVWDMPQPPLSIGPAHDCRDEANKMPQDHPIGLHIVAYRGWIGWQRETCRAFHTE